MVELYIFNEIFFSLEQALIIGNAVLFITLLMVGQLIASYVQGIRYYTIDHLEL